ncbi:DUF1015 domain-containing protein [Priestia taiwanensis]|uniref:DUF1015 domain-containing protein n=1 Tax=Priestia taiwanensis TaxID=1347902 RepID=A0A917ALU4_9BACI|nr:DUF1015 family protein [Priestia taiwanensis]MBM7362295.1 uncharacterized protein (DUF1015 family) [Priestia taiwanensis]GGE61037.1 hypothetical protein GCM10007140_09170 [Priestia taiwanensis]
MVTVKPFKAIRPVRELAAQVAALPYDVLNSDEAREVVKDNPYSFLHVDKAEVDLDSSISLYDDKVYEKAKENLQTLIEKHILVQDTEESLYIYQLTMDGRTQTGLVGCTSVDEYMEGVIKKHEHTRPEKEVDRIRHVDTCDAHTGPIFLTYREKKQIQNVLNEWIQTNQPVYDFTADDSITHTVWVIDDRKVVETITLAFSDVDSLYIADGHHRSASAVKVGLKRREQLGNYTGDEPFNYFLSVMFPDNELHILDYNRIVSDLNGLSVSQFIEQVSKAFTVKEAISTPYKSVEQHTFGMYVDGKWYELQAKEGTFDGIHPVERLDVSILQNTLLTPILGVQDSRSDKRVDFVGGIRGLGELEKLVDSGKAAVAFSMYPTAIQDLFAIADAKEVMPPKSTWFEPKLRSGLFIHSLSE